MLHRSRLVGHRIDEGDDACHGGEQLGPPRAARRVPVPAQVVGGGAAILTRIALSNLPLPLARGLGGHPAVEQHLHAGPARHGDGHDLEIAA